jgi:transposase
MVDVPRMKAAKALRIGPEARAALQRIAASQTAPHRQVVRAGIVLRAGEGWANQHIADDLNVSLPTVRQWRRRFEAGGVEGIMHDAPRPGRPRTITPRKVESIVRKTMQQTPKAATHWSTRSMARATGVSRNTVHRIWQAHDLKPHCVETFAFSRDPEFVTKLIDVVGLYMNPPEHAIVLSVDEKSQVQALERRQPLLPLRQGISARHTHDYKRHGTTTLFAALDVATGEVLADCKSRHRHQEYLAFLKQIDADVDAALAVHLIVDNYATHKHPKVKAWLASHPRFHIHFVPTQSSWLNLVERFFAELTNKRLRRGSFTSVRHLVQAITGYIAEHNHDPQPFVWSASARSILLKLQHLKAIYRTGH